jgi:hypothetical protein
MRLENPEDDINVSGKLSLVITYSFDLDKNLSLSQKLEAMEEIERELVEKIKMLDNVKKVEN